MFELDEYYHTTCLNVQFNLMCWTGLAIFLWSVHPLPTRVSFRIRVASQPRKDDRDSCDTQGNASRGIVPPQEKWLRAVPSTSKSYCSGMGWKWIQW